MQSLMKLTSQQLKQKHTIKPNDPYDDGKLVAKYTIDIQLLTTKAIAPKHTSLTSTVMEVYASKDTILPPNEAYSIHKNILVTPFLGTYLLVSTTKVLSKYSDIHITPNITEETQTDPLMIEEYNATINPIIIPHKNCIP